MDANNFLSDEGEDRIGEELSDSFDKNIKSAKPFLEIEGTIFDDLLPSYEKVKNDIVKQIVQKCKWEFTSRANVYKHEKWMCMPLVSEFYKQTLTDSASDMLISLRNMLHLLKDSINQEIFNTIIKKLSSELDIFYYKDLILHTTFNEGGIHQLDYDINKYLMPILNEFAIDFNVNSFFRLTNESISLIKMKQGPAILLKGLIEKALVIEENRGIIQSSDYDLKTNVYNAKNALKELNIHHLTCEQSRKILSLRADLMN
ncbi:RAD50-interacting 1 isoform X1 [Brachionus plicatilis]|uniref:RAD50-interacting 1 isoform X1 n=1 Tax=Brachionus plicatilis TaxID=10195 RepID=A0A3M7QS76_BRAPC|nr:RAD50-interacting 1 isoform X1 [Brachionus plicatilis]